MDTLTNAFFDALPFALAIGAGAVLVCLALTFTDIGGRR